MPVPMMRRELKAVPANEKISGIIQNNVHAKPVIKQKAKPSQRHAWLRKPQKPVTVLFYLCGLPSPPEFLAAADKLHDLDGIAISDDSRRPVGAADDYAV